MTPRAAPMPPDDRRRAIIAALIPLLVEKGGDVSTRQIASAAGVAEGTIFGVFPDKRALLLAAAEEAVNPADRQATFDAAIEGVTDLRTKIVLVTANVQERMQLTIAVMVALRRHLFTLASETRHRKGAGRIGPPDFVVHAQEDLHRRLTGLFEPHRDELASDPQIAAVALRSLMIGASRPELGMSAALTPAQIADLVLDGVLKRRP